MWRVAGITMAGVMNEIGTGDTVVAGDTDMPAKGMAEAMVVTATVAAMDFAAVRASTAEADSTADTGFMGAADSTRVDAGN
jgi:L-fucose mutarotase/ribose pyranase (RbsD/FucU family)